jgi:hypothetical protein
VAHNWFPLAVENHFCMLASCSAMLFPTARHFHIHWQLRGSKEVVIELIMELERAVGVLSVTWRL